MKNFLRDFFFPPEQLSIAEQNGWDEENEKIMGLEAEIREQYYPNTFSSGIMMPTGIDYEVIKNFYK